jgi:hypothetical protein
MHTLQIIQIVDEDWINVMKVVEEMANYVLGEMLKIIYIQNLGQDAGYSDRFCVVFSRSL